MRAFIQYRNGTPAMESLYVAQAGFEHLDLDIVRFEGLAAPEDVFRDDIVCGYVSTVKAALRKLGVAAEEINYPKELRQFLGRRIAELAYAQVSDRPRNWPVFIKPRGHKRWSGRVIRSKKDLPDPLVAPEECVICSEVVEFASEFRCFVLRGEVVAMKHYMGDPFIVPDIETVGAMVNAYTSSPVAYSLDVGVMRGGLQATGSATRLVEVNDGFSLGTYGVNELTYAKLLYARWTELTGVPDKLQLRP